MTKVLIDDLLRSKLHNFTEAVELCDETGRVVAQVLPALESSDDGCAEPEITEEELERRRQEPDYSTEEVLKYLESL